MPTTTAVAPCPNLERSDVHLSADRRGRAVVVVPDDVALALNAARRIGWIEVAGMGYGESARFLIDSPVTLAISRILAVVARAQLEDHDGHDWTAGGYARVHRTLYAPIVGASGWDESARWWRGGYDASAHLIVGGAAHVDPWTGAVYFAG